MSNIDSKIKRRIVPKTRIKPKTSIKSNIESDIQKSKISIIPSAQELLDDSMAILSQEITRMSAKTKTRALELKEARVLQGYIKSLVELSRESRERNKADSSDLSSMDQTDLLKLVIGMLGNGPGTMTKIANMIDNEEPSTKENKSEI